MHLKKKQNKDEILALLNRKGATDFKATSILSQQYWKKISDVKLKLARYFSCMIRI